MSAMSRLFNILYIRISLLSPLKFIVLSLISNSLNILNVNSYLQMMIMAMVIILAVIVDRFRYAKN